MSCELFLFIRLSKKHMSIDMLVLVIDVCWYILINNIYSTLLYLQCIRPLFHVWYLSAVDNFFHLRLMLIPNKSKVYHVLGFAWCFYYRKKIVLLVAVVYYLIWLLLYRLLENTIILCTFEILIFLIFLLCLTWDAPTFVLSVLVFS